MDGEAYGRFFMGCCFACFLCYLLAHGVGSREFVAFCCLRALVIKDL